jgi:LmbE family N-acetylglucosaminyl deacetylase
MRPAPRDRGLRLWSQAFLLLGLVAFGTPAFSQSEQAPTPTPSLNPPPARLEIPERVRLLIVAPHPDDETLGAGGLMQRVRKLRGRVSVAYLTSGDGYFDGVSLETKSLKPKPADFVEYGEDRLREALRALGEISISPKELYFFGFPDGGLADLLTTHWSSKQPFVSPYTGDDRPPYRESFDRDTPYSGVALERVLARVITQVNPTWIAVTAPWDIHPDHCAAYHFVVRALHRLSQSNRDFTHTQLLAYTVHRPDWPAAREGALLPPPGNVPLQGGEWRFLYLTSDELDGKGRALDQYASQMDIMAILFRSFVRPNEVFAFYNSLPPEPPQTCAPQLQATPTAHPNQ